MRSWMRALLQRLHDGDLSFDRFAREATPYFTGHAVKMRSRWQAPPSLGVDDIVQEMLFGAYRASQTYDRGRGVNYATYVVVGAMHEGLRVIHHMRRAYQRSGRNLSRFDLPIAMLSADPEYDDVILNLVSYEFDADAVLDAKRRVERLIGNESDPRRAFVLAAYALSNFDVDAAAGAIYRDPESREVVRCRDYAATRRYVQDTVAVFGGAS